MNEEREILAEKVAKLLGITKEQALDLAVLARELPKKSVTFEIRGPYILKINCVLSNVVVYQMRGETVDFLRRISTLTSDPLHGLLWASEWVLNVPLLEVPEVKVAWWRKATILIYRMFFKINKKGEDE